MYGTNCRRNWKSGLRAQLAGISCAAIAVLLVQPTLSAKGFRRMGNLPGGISESVVLGVSGNGRVAVGHSSSDRGVESVAWHGDDFQLLREPEDGFRSHAWATTWDGNVIVGGNVWSDNDREAFRWENGQFIGLGYLDSRYVISDATAVSADGHVVVGYSAVDEGAPEFEVRNEAFRWENGVMTGLGHLPGTVYSEAYDVSSDGTVIVGRSSGTGRSEAFRWENGVMTGLGSVSAGGFSGAFGVSADGSVIVGSGHSLDGRFEAFRWEDGIMTGLGIPGGSDDFTHASAVSADGSIIVGTGELPQRTRAAAYIWDAEHGARVLSDVLHNDYGISPDGWRLLDATDISADGKTIVGYGWNPDGDVAGWMVRVPEPASIIVSMVGISGVLAFLTCRRIASFRTAQRERFSEQARRSDLSKTGS